MNWEEFEKQHYGKEYWVDGKFSPYTGYPNTNSLTDLNIEFANHYKIIKSVVPNITSIVEWGCATGEFLKLPKNEGVSVVGYELSSWCIENKVIDEVSKLNACECVCEDIACADVHYSSHFMEHLPQEDILPFLIKISKKCKYMVHVIPSYKFETNIPSQSHLTQINREWWINTFKKLDNFTLIEYPNKERQYIKTGNVEYVGAYILVKK